MTRNKTIAAFASAVLCCAGTASADLVQHSFSVGPASAGGSYLFDLPQLDPSTGTLLSVTVDVEVSQSLRLTAIRNGTPVGIDAEIFIFGSGHSALSAIVPVYGAVALGDIYQEVSGLADDTAFSTTTLSQATESSNTSSGTITDADILAMLTGSGVIPLNLLHAVTWNAFSSDGEAFSSVTSTGLSAGVVTVTYDYGPVPEPATFAVLGGALLLARRRRR